jgi:hypothetical protein
MAPSNTDWTGRSVPDFTAPGYAAILRCFLDLGYDVRAFETAQNDARHLVLRHDIDMSIQAASTIAEIESDLGLKATYFVLLRSDLYNPFSSENLLSLKQIAAMGHDVGLHFDASLYAADRKSLEQAASRECTILEALLEQRVRTISFHRPSEALLGLPGMIAGRRHTYEPYFFREMGYCSDSRGEWAYGHPLNHPEIGKGRALQLLTHPIWWTGSDSIDRIARLNSLRIGRDRSFAEALAANCEPYRAAITEQQVKS